MSFGSDFAGTTEQGGNSTPTADGSGGNQLLQEWKRFVVKTEEVTGAVANLAVSDSVSTGGGRGVGSVGGDGSGGIKEENGGDGNEYVGNDSKFVRAWELIVFKGHMDKWWGPLTRQQKLWYRNEFLDACRNYGVAYAWNDLSRYAIRTEKFRCRKLFSRPNTLAQQDK